MSATTSPAPPRGSALDPAVWLLSIGHAVDDLYQGAVPALIPFFVAARHWDYLTASGITLAATVLSSVAHPVFGMLTDRRGLPWLVPLGMSVAGAGIGLSGLGRPYALTWLAIALSGLGIAAYHPESARLARRAAGGSHVAMSWFSPGGNAGFALGPLAAGAVLRLLGTGGTPVLAVPALACAAVTWHALRRARWAWSPGARACQVFCVSFGTCCSFVTLLWVVPGVRVRRERDRRMPRQRRSWLLSSRKCLCLALLFRGPVRRRRYDAR